jgi:hypothetical protein
MDDAGNFYYFLWYHCLIPFFLLTKDVLLLQIEYSLNKSFWAQELSQVSERESYHKLKSVRVISR